MLREALIELSDHDEGKHIGKNSRRCHEETSDENNPRYMVHELHGRLKRGPRTVAVQTAERRVSLVWLARQRAARANDKIDPVVILIVSP